MLLRTKLIVAAVGTIAVTVAGISCLAFDQTTVSNINSKIGDIQSYENNFGNAPGIIKQLIEKIDTLNAGDNVTNNGQDIINKMNANLQDGKLSGASSSQIESAAKNAAENKDGDIVNPYKAAWAYEYDEVSQANSAVKDINFRLDAINNKLSIANTTLGKEIKAANGILNSTQQK